MKRIHEPVMAAEAIEFLAIKPSATYIDATAGFGGHAEAILKELKKGKLILIDRDQDAVKYLQNQFRDDARVSFIHGNFGDLDLPGLRGHSTIAGILFDLGTSSYQIDSSERGFSFQAEGPLDMRMDQSQTLTAYDVVNSYSLHDLTRVIRDYGEERYAERIAKAVVRRRPISTTTALAEEIAQAVPRQGRTNPATRTFQAIRIEVNNELESLQRGLEQALRLLADKGRLVVITFHSLEERLVKVAFREARRGGLGKVLIDVPVAPSVDEVKRNPRARSAKLRVFERSIA